MSNAGPSWIDSASSFLERQSRLDDVVTICSLLGNQRRQYIVFYLLGCDADEWVPMGEVARWATAVEREYRLDEATGNEYRNMRESFRHTHLQALAEADVIEYDMQRTRLKAGDRLTEIGSVLLQLLLMTGQCR